MNDFIKDKRPPKPERALEWLLLGMLGMFALLSFAYAGLKILRINGSVTLWASGCAVLSAICISLLLLRALKNASSVVISLAIFLLALLPRVLFGTLAECAPVSDFANYRQFALWLEEGNRELVAGIAQDYQLTEFAGLAVLNYLLAQLFTSSIGGMQLASAVISSLICTLIYHLGARYRKSCGIVAALAYAWYPASIVASQILTNQHGATLFALLSLLSLLRSVRAQRILPSAGYAVLSGALLVISHFFHPSSITTQIAVACFLGMTALHQNRASIARILCSLVCFFLTFQLALSGCTGLLRSQQLLPEQLQTNSPLPKIVVGLNPETGGAYSAEDYASINALPPEERSAYCMQLIKERVSQPTEIIKTLAVKTFSMWVRTDNLFLFYAQGVESGAHAGTARAENALAWAEALQLWDALFLALIYVGAAVGLFCVLREHSSHTVVRLLLWVILGWMGAHMLSEIQPRYRYYPMPMLMVFWGIGSTYLWSKRTVPSKMGL